MVIGARETLFATLIGTLVLTGCGNSDRPNKAQTNQKQGKVLPFKVCSLINNDAFQDNLSMIDIDAKVQGGQSNDWAATAIAIAKHLGALGISTDVKVTLSRSDLGDLEQETQNGFKWLSQVYYAIDPKHSIGMANSNDKQWLISYATDKSVATLQDIHIANDYEKFIEKNYDEEKIDKIIKAKYQLKNDWRLPMSNMVSNTSNPEDYAIDESGQKDALGNLEDLAKANTHTEQKFDCVF
ncbi:hypothetical protein ACX1NX_00595 [Acinetobacter sp. ANC 5383]